MAEIKVYHTSEDIGRFANWTLQEGFAMPLGLLNIHTPEQNVPNSEYLRTGNTHIAIGGGGDVTMSGVIEAARAIFIENPGYLMDSVNGDMTKQLPTWTQAMCWFAIDLWHAARNGRVHQISDAIEAYSNAWFWRMDYSYAPQQCEWMAERWKYWMDQIGGTYYHDYGGTLYYVAVSENLRIIEPTLPALLNNDVALEFYKAHESGVTPYFKKKLWRYHGALHNVYYRAHLTPEQNLFATLIGAQLHQNAMKSNEVVSGGGSNQRFCAFSMDEGMEFSGFTQIDKFPVAGGTLTGTNFPIYSWKFHNARSFLHWNFFNARWGWGDCIHHGLDTSVLGQYWERYVYEGSGVGVTIKNQNQSYQPDGAGIKTGPLGMNLGDYEGNKWYAKTVEHCGAAGFAKKFLRFRENTATSSFVSDADDYLGRRCMESGGMGFWYQGNTSKRSVYFVTPENFTKTAGSPDRTWRSWQLDIGLGTPHTTPLLAPGTIYHRHFD